MAEAATVAFLADTTASNAMPWRAFTQNKELDADKEYYCVATWGLMSIMAPAFWSKTTQVSVAELPRGQCIGESRGGRMVWPCNFVAETLTVWHDRKYSTEFFRANARRQGMQAHKDSCEYIILYNQTIKPQPAHTHFFLHSFPLPFYVLPRSLELSYPLPVEEEMLFIGIQLEDQV